MPPPLKALVVGLGSIGRRHARNWVALGLGPVAVCRQTNSLQPEPLGIEAREFTMGGLLRAIVLARYAETSL